MKGIDISYYQGNVDFSKIKKQFEYVIIRLGLGDNVTSQDDVKYKEYIENTFMLVMPNRLQKIKCSICSYQFKT